MNDTVTLIQQEGTRSGSLEASILFNISLVARLERRIQVGSGCGEQAIIEELSVARHRLVVLRRAAREP